MGTVVTISNHTSVGGGKTVLHYLPGATTVTNKTLANLASGVYFVIYRSTDGLTSTEKIIKN